MLVFIDESYDKDSHGQWHYALAGFGIDEFRYRALQAAVYQLTKDAFVDRNSLGGRDWSDLLQDKIVIERSPEGLELKSSQLLKLGSLKRFGGEGSPHCRLVAGILESVRKCRGTSIGVLVNPDHPTDVKDTRQGCPVPYQRLLNIVGAWMRDEFEGRPVSLVMDTEHSGINLPLSRAISSYMYQSSAGRQMKHIVPSPFWIDSQSMAGAQVADLIAHILMNAMKPERERKPLPGLTRQVYELRHEWAGRDGGTISRLRRQQPAGEG